jgi:hypothetical protein
MERGPNSLRETVADPATVTQKIFQNLDEHELIALFVLSLLSFPVTKRGEHPQAPEWNERVLLLFKQQLMISEDYYDAYKMVTPTAYHDPTNREISQVFVDVLSHHRQDRVTDRSNLLLLGKLSILLILNGFYDARGRHLVRNLRTYLNLSEADALSLEVYLGSAFLALEDTITRSKKPTENDSKMLKYAKIGAVGLGAGALLAFTGGLAAPAVAAAFVLLGGSTFVAAGLTSAAALASVFGTAGAGLAGYKMARRIRGIEEFEFEPQGKKVSHCAALRSSPQLSVSLPLSLSLYLSLSLQGKLAVMIAVSGWLLDDEDYKRMYGIVPDDLTLEERLERFYEIHCPERSPPFPCPPFSPASSDAGSRRPREKPSSGETIPTTSWNRSLLRPRPSHLSVSLSC